MQIYCGPLGVEVSMILFSGTRYVKRQYKRAAQVTKRFRLMLSCVYTLTEARSGFQYPSYVTKLNFPIIILI